MILKWSSMVIWHRSSEVGLSTLHKFFVDCCSEFVGYKLFTPLLTVIVPQVREFLYKPKSWFLMRKLNLHDMITTIFINLGSKTSSQI